MTTGFSIIVCSYNPDHLIFRRVLNALEKLNKSSLNIEFIFIDNNSSPSLKHLNCLNKFLVNCSNSRYFLEINPGLTASRLRGFKESKFEWLIYFDDDNEPNVDYLIHLENVIKKYPEVSCWGPAKITVEYTSSDNDDWIQNKKVFFQERNWGKTQFGISPIWQDYFPYGTGLIVKNEIMFEYQRRLLSGQYNLTDRKKTNLISGGDLQIVLTATNMNRPVGTIDGLVINHLISNLKTSVSYLERLNYGTASSYIAAHKQVDSALPFDVQLSNNWHILKQFIFLCRRSILKKSINDFRLELAGVMGSINARFIYINIPNKPFLIRLYERIINA